MSKRSKPFEMSKTFGLGVLLKLTKTKASGIQITENRGKLTANVSMRELIQAVDATMAFHNIRLKMI